MSGNVHLIASHSERGWTDFEGQVTMAETIWISKAGAYAMVSQRLLNVITREAIDAHLDAEHLKKDKEIWNKL